jgi:hypothetical protein
MIKAISKILIALTCSTRSGKKLFFFMLLIHRIKGIFTIANKRCFRACSAGYRAFQLILKMPRSRSFISQERKQINETFSCSRFISLRKKHKKNLFETFSLFVIVAGIYSILVSSVVLLIFKVKELVSLSAAALPR